MTDATQRALAAFRRLLEDAARGGQAKVDALVAMAQRTVFVATWTAGGDDYRTLLNSTGQAALPVFTDQAQLHEAASRFGWKLPDGSVPGKEIGARKAFRHVIAEEVPFLIVDITAPYSLEVQREEIEPLVSGGTRSDSQGPYAAVGRISSTMLEVVKASPPPDADQRRSGPPSSQQALPQVTGTPEPAPPPAPPPPAPAAPAAAAPAGGPAATFGSGTSVTLAPLTTTPSDELLDALANVLREFPEVEWAAFCNAARGPTQPMPTVGLRVDTSYRARVNEIIGQLKSVADSQGATVDVLLLDDAQLMRQARSEQLVFFPWRR